MIVKYKDYREKKVRNFLRINAALSPLLRFNFTF